MSWGRGTRSVHDATGGRVVEVRLVGALAALTRLARSGSCACGATGGRDNEPLGAEGVDALTALLAGAAVAGVVIQRVSVVGDLVLPSARVIVPSSEACTPLPALGVPLVGSTGQAATQAPLHADRLGWSFSNRYRVRPPPSTRIVPSELLAVATVATPDGVVPDGVVPDGAAPP
jgi:hypothetical protein